MNGPNTPTTPINHQLAAHAQDQDENAITDSPFSPAEVYHMPPPLHRLLVRALPLALRNNDDDTPTHPTHFAQNRQQAQDLGVRKQLNFG